MSLLDDDTLVGRETLEMFAVEVTDRPDKFGYYKAFVTGKPEMAHLSARGRSKYAALARVWHAIGDYYAELDERAKTLFRKDDR